MKVKKLTFFLFLLTAQSLQAQDPKPPLAPLPKIVDKYKWQEQMQAGLPSEFCKSDQYFMQCFELTKQECLDFSHLFVQACINNVTVGIPESVDREQAVHWGRMIGRCSADLFEKFLQKKKKSTKECKEIKPPMASKP